MSEGMFSLVTPRGSTPDLRKRLGVGRQCLTVETSFKRDEFPALFDVLGESPALEDAHDQLVVQGCILHLISYHVVRRGVEAHSSAQGS